MEVEDWWWLSFADENGNLGICIVQGTNFIDAVRESKRQGCNPGGEVRGWVGNEENKLWAQERELLGVNRLIQRDELENALECVLVIKGDGDSKDGAMPAKVYHIECDGKKIRVPSVTTILKQLGWSTNGLIYWANKVGLDGLTLEDARGKAADVGTVVHEVIAAELHGNDRPDIGALPNDMKAHIDQALAAWGDWKQRYKFKPYAMEQSLVSQERRFGGTFDAVLTDERTSIIDFKTGGIYGEHLCQIAAYGQLWNEHNPNNPVQRYHLLKLGKEDGSFAHYSYPAESMEAPWDVFCHARQLYELEKKLKAQV